GSCDAAIRVHGDDAKAVHPGGERDVLAQVYLGELARRLGALQRLLPSGELVDQRHGGAGGIVEGELADALAAGLDEAARGIGVLERELLLPPGAHDDEVATLGQDRPGTL